MVLRTLPTRLREAILIEPYTFEDNRGLFKETYVRSKYSDIGITDDFVQDSISVSSKNVLRGLHSDPKMSKLVQVVHGRAFDVIVDARRLSPTFGEWQGFELSEHNHRQIYVPAGFLHGFLALSDHVVFTYKQGAEYAPQREIGVVWNDPTLAIEWPLSVKPNVSEKDAYNLSFAAAFVEGTPHENK